MRCAVLGDPVEHSLSPPIHRAAYAGLGLDWTYDAIGVPAGELGAMVLGLDPGRWRGLSLTMPLKREAVALLDSADRWVAATGVCNTVLLEPDATLHGLNTDITGTMAVLGAHGVPQQTAVVLGGGATATSVLLAMTERGLRHATLAVRDPTRVEETVAAVLAHPRPPAIEVTSLSNVGRLDADVLISTVPVAAQSPDLLAAVGDVGLVFDVLYDPWPTPLAASAAAAGRRVVTGLDLLLAQAVGQLEAMTGRSDLPLAAMRRAAEAELALR